MDNENKLTQADLENVTGGAVGDAARRYAIETAEACKANGIPFEEALKAASNDGACFTCGLSGRELRAIVKKVYGLG